MEWILLYQLKSDRINRIIRMLLILSKKRKYKRIHSFKLIFD
ncbi:hypothetical protein D1BOALGB6SA_6811 [Olavius sp. associated proteobacterium Delta 1]|nr:hypothetical protein D1BOALGB6SA_6811 [Olavius sp. associated proteobacterium Delta 1]